MMRKLEQLTPREERCVLASVLMMAIAVLGLVLLFGLGGCASWQARTTKVVLGVEAGAKSAKAFLGPHCARAEMNSAVEACAKAGDAECAPLQRCEVATKALHSLFTAVLVAKLAIQADDESPAQAAVQAAVQAVVPVAKAVEVWK